MSTSNTVKTVLFVGQKPETVDFSDPALPSGFDASKIHAGISVGMQQMHDHGWDADLCLVQPDASAAVELSEQLANKSYDCVVIGGGIRLPPNSLQLFETLVNIVLIHSPHTRIAFNTTPLDTADAAQRWL